MPGKRGKIVMDEGSYEGHMRKVIQKVGYEVIHIPPQDLGQTDEAVLRKRAKGTWPVFTKDKTMYKSNPKDGGATGFVVIENNVSPEEMDGYKVIVGGFLEKHTSKTLAGKQWEVAMDGSVKTKKLPEAK